MVPFLFYAFTLDDNALNVKGWIHFFDRGQKKAFCSKDLSLTFQSAGKFWLREKKGEYVFLGQLR
jgi:hypothetical protein